MSGKYILDNQGQPKRIDDLFEWAEWFEDSFEQRRVAATHLEHYCVSTVFLALDHRFGPGAPILWETMVFDPNDDSVYCERCGGNREQAEAMHASVVEQFQAKEKINPMKKGREPSGSPRPRFELTMNEAQTVKRFADKIKTLVEERNPMAIYRVTMHNAEHNCNGGYRYLTSNEQARLEQNKINEDNETNYEVLKIVIPPQPTRKEICLLLNHFGSHPDNG